MLALGVLAQAAGAMFANAPAFLIPTLQSDYGVSLSRAGLIAAAPTLGFLVSLMAWGAVVDRIGERRVLVIGLSVTALASAGAALSQSFALLGVFLVLGGMAASSANAASGRVVVGWFPPERRGLAMGIRQMALPLGVAFAALTVPQIAESHGVGWALALPTAVTIIAAAACLLIVDPPRPTRAAAKESGLLDNPYRGRGMLWRIHGVSVLLVVPQYLVWTFMLVWLMTDRNWSAASAGILITFTQLLGAAGRIGAGFWSDRVRSRMGPMRWVAVAAAVSMLAVALTDWLDSPAAVALMVIASVITTADNGLAFTAVAEIAGPYWSGRALGAQNTTQYVAATLVPPIFGGLIGLVSFPLTFAIAALFPLAAVPLVPEDPPERV
ncbi:MULTISPECIES: MFS transporter [unclassified Rhodococcus (in: high G+C Gram-positive bacteria)]|uniref:MFS transporter n=1 Tax=unclassified Rhodococcus (in: high G+C Gram-positive bacteria) TaxID=192944 RepID=UPI000E0C387F|nr:MULTISPECIES: MFS transporter [unclassified Rhodococcus (in: high G+C Gram-positive bacteria)]QKT14224.1 MFS transporter [Rhodococcus sp. W8901]